ncbi:unnamed protein product, partial [marine sediment metagenome]
YIGRNEIMRASEVFGEGRGKAEEAWCEVCG